MPLSGEQSTIKSNLLDLSDDILQQIIINLSLKDFYNFTRVTKSLMVYFQNLQYDNLFRVLLNRENPLAVEWYIEHRHPQKDKIIWKNLTKTIETIKKELKKTVNITDKNLYVEAQPTQWKHDKLPDFPEKIIECLGLSHYKMFMNKKIKPGKCIGCLDPDGSLMVDIDFYRKDPTRVEDKKNFLPSGILSQNEFDFITENNISVMDSGRIILIKNLDPFYSTLPKSAFLGSIHSLTSAFLPSNHWKFDPPLVYDIAYDSIPYSIVGDMLYIIGLDLATRKMYIGAFKRNSDIYKPSKMIWRTIFEFSWNNWLAASKHYIQVKLSMTLNGFKQDFLHAILYRETGEIIGIHDNRLDYNHFKITGSKIYCSRFNNLESDPYKGTFEILTQPLVDFLKSLDTSYNHHFQTESFGKNPTKASEIVIPVHKDLKIEGYNNKINWDVVMELEEETDKSIKYWMITDGILIVLQNSRVCPWYEEEEDRPIETTEHLFLYDLTTLKKRFYKFQNLSLHSELLYISNELNIVTWSDRFCVDSSGL